MRKEKHMTNENQRGNTDNQILRVFHRITRKYVEGSITTTIKEFSPGALGITQEGGSKKYNDNSFFLRDLDTILWSANGFLDEVSEGRRPQDERWEASDGRVIFDQGTTYFSQESRGDQMLFINTKVCLKETNGEPPTIVIDRYQGNEANGESSYDEFIFSIELLSRVVQDFAWDEKELDQ
jgi:hypothetical protein